MHAELHVPFFDLGRQNEQLREPMEQAICDTLASKAYILGPNVERLERAIADYVGTPHAVGISSGTDALLVSLMALGISRGDVVVTTPYSFFATAGVIVRLGARPVFADIDPDTYNIDPGALEACLTDHPQAKAVIAVHLYGQCAEMVAINRLAQARGAAVIEDAAQALGSRCPHEDGTRMAGALGDLGCFSFYPTKNLGGVGEGGMVTTSDGALAERVRALRNHGQTSRYHHDMVGGNFRLNAIQAAALLVKLPHLEQWHAARRRHAQRYDEAFAGLPLQTPHIAHGRDDHIYNQYIIRVPEKRDALVEYLREHNVGCAVYYPVPFHMQPCFAELGYREGDFPRAEHAARHTLALPIFPELTDEMVDTVITRVRAFYGR